MSFFNPYEQVEQPNPTRPAISCRFPPDLSPQKISPQAEIACRCQGYLIKSRFTHKRGFFGFLENDYPELRYFDLNFKDGWCIDWYTDRAERETDAKLQTVKNISDHRGTLFFPDITDIIKGGEGYRNQILIKFKDNDTEVEMEVTAKARRDVLKWSHCLKVIPFLPNNLFADTS